MTQEPSSTNEQTAFRILDDLFNLGRLQVIDETCSKDIVVHAPSLAGDINGIEAFKAFIKDFLYGFTITHLHVENLHSEGDTVDAHAVVKAVNTGPFMGMPRTANEITIEPVYFFKFGPDGKVIEHWQEIDKSDLMQQLKRSGP